jgi:hypothetical protein
MDRQPESEKEMSRLAIIDAAGRHMGAVNRQEGLWAVQ